MCILMAIYMSESSEETVCRLFASDIIIGGPSPCVMVCAAIGYKTWIPLVWNNSNLNTDWYISDTLSPVVVPYLTGLSNSIFQQDNVRPYVAFCVLTFINIQSTQLLSWPAWSPDMSPIENQGYKIKRLARQHSE